MTAEIVLRHLPQAFPLERESDREAWRVVSVTGSGACAPGEIIRRRQVDHLRRDGWKVTIT